MNAELKFKIYQLVDSIEDENILQMLIEETIRFNYCAYLI